jgi:hypothetical protein
VVAASDSGKGKVVYFYQNNCIRIPASTDKTLWRLSMVPKNVPSKAEQRATQQHQMRKLQSQLSRCKR